MAEFALIAPVLFGLAFGVFDFGRGMSANVTVTNSSREGARYLATHATSWNAAVAPAGVGKYNNSCYGASVGGSIPTAPVPDSPQGKAWEQLQNASLDLTTVSMTVKFFKSSVDPSVAGAAVADQFTCSAGVLSESNSTYTPQSGDWVQFEVKYSYSPATPLINALIKTVVIDQTTTMVLE